MEIKEIKQMVKLMVDNDLSELDVTDGESRISLKRGMGNVPVVTMAAAPPPAAPVEPAPSEKLEEIKSPMVGTCYLLPSPDGEPYVSVGSTVSADSITCIVEAMKVMNEIKADCSGTIVEVCVKNTQPVEFGQVLFRVKGG